MNKIYETVRFIKMFPDTGKNFSGLNTEQRK